MRKNFRNEGVAAHFAEHMRRVKDFGSSKEVNKVRFKEQILSHFPEAQAQSDGKNIILKECS